MISAQAARRPRPTAPAASRGPRTFAHIYSVTDVEWAGPYVPLEAPLEVASHALAPAHVERPPVGAAATLFQNPEVPELDGCPRAATDPEHQI